MPKTTATESELLNDFHGRAMPTVPKKKMQAVSFDAATTSNRSTEIPGSVCLVRATGDVFIKRGGSTVTGTVTPAEDVFFVGSADGWMDYNVPDDKRYIAPLAASGSGTLYIIEVGT